MGNEWTKITFYGNVFMVAKRNVSPTVVIFLLQVEILNHKECTPKARTTKIFLIRYQWLWRSAGVKSFFLLAGENKIPSKCCVVRSLDLKKSPPHISKQNQCAVYASCTIWVVRYV
jgi:hypothetical protein